MYMNNKMILATETKLIPVLSFADALRKNSNGSIYCYCNCGCGQLAGKPVKKIRNGKLYTLAMRRA